MRPAASVAEPEAASEQPAATPGRRAISICSSSCPPADGQRSELLVLIGLSQELTVIVGRPIVVSGLLRVAGEETIRAARENSLDERFKVLLPELLGKPRPSSEDGWPTFRRVQGLAALTRHAIDEPTRRKGFDGEVSLSQRYYTGEFEGTTRMMFECFEYFCPGWVPASLGTLGH